MILISCVPLGLTGSSLPEVLEVECLDKERHSPQYYSFIHSMDVYCAVDLGMHAERGRPWWNCWI